MPDKGRNRKAKKSSPAEAIAEDEAGVPFCRGWLWWSSTPSSARKPPKDDFDKRLPPDIRKEFHVLMRTYRDRPDDLKPGVHYKVLDHGVVELRVERHNNPYRLLFFRWHGYAVALDVFFKNQQQTPTDRARTRKTQWEATRPPPA